MKTGVGFWTKKEFCLSCGLKKYIKPNDACEEKKHLEYYANKRKKGNELRRQKRKINPYYGSRFDKESWKKHTREQIRKKRINVVERLGNKCIVCGYSDPRALQIDHINGGGGKETVALCGDDSPARSSCIVYRRQRSGQPV